MMASGNQTSDIFDAETFFVGRPDEWRQFAMANPKFLEVHAQKLFDLAKPIFDRTWKSNSQADLVVFGLGLLCYEDFEEIYTLAGNGYGFGALKLLRGMFERLVTATFIHKNRDRAKAFIEYEHIRQFKLANSLYEVFGEEFMKKENLDALVAQRDAVKINFKRKCPTKGCGRDDLAPISWIDVDFVSMTRAAGEGLAGELAAAYGLPMQETHPSFSAVLARMDGDEVAKTFENRQAKARLFVPSALVLAHNFLLRTYELQLKHFPEIAEPIQPLFEECAAGFLTVWKKGDGIEPSSGQGPAL